MCHFTSQAVVAKLLHVAVIQKIIILIYRLTQTDTNSSSKCTMRTGWLVNNPLDVIFQVTDKRTLINMGNIYYINMIDQSQIYKKFTDMVIEISQNLTL